MKKWYFLFFHRIDDLDFVTQEMMYRSFYRFTYKDIYFIVKDHPLAEDVIQEAFIKTVAKGPLLRSRDNIPGWIKQVTRRTALDKLRKLKKEVSSVTVYDSNFLFSSSEINIASEVESQIRDEKLHQAITELKPSHSSIIRLFYLEGKSYKDIAAKLNITEVVLTQRLARARKKLHQIFVTKWAD